MNLAENLKERIEQTASAAIAENRLVGTAILVAHKGEIIFRDGFGWADREKNRPMQADTTFRFASCTKVIVSLATMALVEQGLIKLDDTVTKFLPDFKPQTPSGQTPEITVHHLLTHTAGLNYCFMEPGNQGPYNSHHVSDGLDHSGVTLEENLRRITEAGLIFAPGSAWHYSVATDVLGAVLQKATRLDLSDVIRRYVTHPLQMNDTEFWALHPDHLARPYHNAPGEPAPMSDGYRAAPEPGMGSLTFSPSRALDKTAFRCGGGGLVGTADDLIKALEVLHGRANDVIELSTAENMRRNQIGELAIPMLPPGYGFGLGFAVLRDPVAAGMPMNKGTLQWGGAYGHSWFVDVIAELTVVALTNTAPEGNFGKFPLDLKNAIYEN